MYNIELAIGNNSTEWARRAVCQLVVRAAELALSQGPIGIVIHDDRVTAFQWPLVLHDCFSDEDLRLVTIDSDHFVLVDGLEDVRRV